VRVSVDVVGTWRLVAWRRIVDDQTVTYPLGEDADGVLIYTPDGGMAVVLTAAKRPEMPRDDPLGGDVDKRAEAYSTCLAYIGTYELRGEEVVHRIDVSLYPAWSGDEQVRPFTYTGDELVLRTPPTHTASGTVVNEIAWSRSSPDSAS
jgi:Lipocalin-like domain